MLTQHAFFCYNHSMKLFFQHLLFLYLLIPALAAAQSFTGVTIMDFNWVEDGGGAGRGIQLGTDGSIVYSGNISGSGSGSPASAVITGTTGLTVAISCDKIATLADATTGSTVAVKNIGATLGTTTAPYSGLTLCKGIGRRKEIFQHVITGITTQDTLRLGGEISISGQPVVGDFSTANTGGAPFIINIVYQ